MKYTTLAAALLLSSTSAFAADAIVYNEPAPVAVVDTFSWTGGYVGLNAGYAGGKNKYNEYGTNFSAKDNSNGFLGGIQAGYNWQFDQMIVGLETDIQGAGLKSDVEVGGVGAEAKINWFGTTRARLGYTPVDRFMVYATGGVAYGKIKASAFDGVNSFSQSDTKVGYTVGAGAEYALSNNVTLKSEYLYTDLGKLKLDDVNGNRFGEVKAPFHTVRVGVNYKF
ncbi:porin family protein [Bacillus subtilis]|uniref:outer membrane protein n=1 Tax=Pseudochrobactrum asaccharolyticum TaxID=354351 RepID=UPI001F26AD87|nr:outer membrane protein [Pseudochrobactrum asaccharolyticum]MCF7645883.1 porin family protein [Pseudochrobactrum asaccharolyticum]MCF7672348.1 porin family protein [Bacillus subtilis]